MEEFREAAVLYYNNTSAEVQNLAKQYFNSMDTNGDGRIARDEFIEFLQRNGYTQFSSDHFAEFDRNGDGSLDFSEVVTMYYVLCNRVWCNGCKKWLNGLYFSCVTCFRFSENPFDLCCPCYRGQKISHHHNADQFLDNYALLGHARSSLRQSKSQSYSSAITATNYGASESLRLLSTGLQVGSSAASLASNGLQIGTTIASFPGCNIM